MCIKRRGTTILLLVLALMIAAGCAQVTTLHQPAIHKEPGRPEVFIWPNRNSHSSNEATLRLVVKAGSLQETDEERGYAHFVEHMAFNGTENFPDDRLRERMRSLGLELGSHSNAYTAFDHTAYTIHLNTVDPDRLEAAIELLSEWAYRIEFSEEEVRKERPVIENEWRQRKAREGRANDQLQNDYYAGSRFLEREPVGTLASIESATSEELGSFYQRWYHPDNMAVIVAGDIDQDQVRKLVDTYFPVHETGGQTPRTWSLNPDAMQDWLAVTDPFTTSGYIDLNYFVESPVPRTKQQMLEQQKWWAALDIWYDRAQARLTETGGSANDVDFYFEYPSRDLLHIALSATLADTDYKTALSIIEGERSRLLQSGISQEELNQWVEGRLEHERSQQDSAGYLADSMTDHFLQNWPMLGQSEWVDMLEATLPSFTPEQVRAALEEKMGAAAVKMRLIHPHTHPAPEAMQMNAWLDEAASVSGGKPMETSSSNERWSIHPETEGRIIAERTIDPDVTEWTLSNGMTVLYRHSNQAPGKVYYQLVGEGGLNLMDEQDVMDARLALPTLAQSGLRDFDGAALSEWLNSRGLEQHPALDFFDRGMVGSGPAERFPVLMRLLHVALTESSVDPQTWHHVKNQNQSELAQLAEHPHLPWIETVQSTVHANDPAVRTMTPAELEAVTPAGLQRIYDTYYAGAQNYRLAIVGDIDRDRVRRSVLESVATLPESGPEQIRPRPYPTARESSRERVYGSGERQAIAVLRYSLDKEELELPHDRSASYLAKWLNQHLTETIREDKGSVYSIQASVDGYLTHQSDYTLILELGTDPEAVDTVIESVDETLDTLTRQPPESQSLETWKATIEADFEQAVNSARNQANQIAYAPMLDRTVTSLLVFEDRPVPDGALLTTMLGQLTGPEARRVELVWLP